MKTNSPHDASILDQFTRQAIPFSKRHGASDGELLRLLVEVSGVGPQDRVLDVACGPGLVSCAFAPKVRHVTGLDMVPAMLERAQAVQVGKGVSNVDWKEGSAMELPFADAEFDAVVTRFSFHHYLKPEEAFREMMRVCKPGGVIVVSDVVTTPETQAAYDEVEKWRDPSHTCALTEAQLESIGQAAGVPLEQAMRYRLESDLEGLLRASFPREGDADKVRARFRKEIESGANQLGVGAHFRSGAIYFHFPILTLVWRKP